MEILNESSGHLEANIDSFSKSLDLNKAQVEIACQQLAGNDLQSIKEKRDFKRNILIFSLVSAGLLVFFSILIYKYSSRDAFYSDICVSCNTYPK